VVRLKLNADRVVLSACNTAAADKPGVEALSGLARAFVYAGARALLVSHWSVDSKAAGSPPRRSPSRRLIRSSPAQRPCATRCWPI
jgi:CHAT domain